MLIAVLPLVARRLVVQACRSSYMDRALRYCHCLCVFLRVHVNNALVKTTQGAVSVIFSAFAAVLAGGGVGGGEVTCLSPTSLMRRIIVVLDLS